MTEARAMRMAIGITTYEMADLIDCSQASISKAEREVGCRKIFLKEMRFLNEVFNVLDPSEKVDVKTIAYSLMQREEILDSMKEAVISASNAMRKMAETINV